MSNFQCNDADEQNISPLMPTQNAGRVGNDTADIIATARRLRADYHDMDQGYHRELHAMIERMYGLGKQLNHNASALWEVIHQVYFQENALRPKIVAPMKAAVFSTMTPTSESAKDRARKFTKMLDVFQNHDLVEGSIVDYIERCGGVEFILANLSKAVRILSPTSVGSDAKALTLLSPAVGEDDTEPSDVIDSPISVSPVEIASPGTSLYEALVSVEPSKFALKRHKAIVVDEKKDLVVSLGETVLRSSFDAVEKARSPQIYLIAVTISPPDEYGFFQVHGVLQEQSQATNGQEVSSSRDAAAADGLAPTAEDAAGTPAVNRVPVPSQGGSRAEGGYAAVSETKPAAIVALSNSDSQHKSLQRSTPKQLMPPLDKDKGKERTMSARPKINKSIVVVKPPRSSGSGHSNGVHPQGGPSRPRA